MGKRSDTLTSRQSAAKPSHQLPAAPIQSDRHVRAVDVIGVVVIGRNEGERLQACLRSLCRARVPVVYVDSGSSDGSVERARALGVEVVMLDMSRPFTAARARNAGWAALRASNSLIEFVQFVDGDCELVSGWLRRAYQFLRSHAGHAVTVAVTSPTVASGKTLVAINLAFSIAHQTHRTAMLVDFDLRRPMVARYLGLERSCTLNDVLQGDAEVSQALVNPGMPHLVVLPTGRPLARSAEVLTSVRSRRLIHELRDRYPDRVVIFDLPPVLAVDDVLAVLPHIDCVLMVVGSGVSSRREISDAMHHIEGSELLGVVVNKDETPVRRRYGYY